MRSAYKPRLRRHAKIVALTKNGMMRREVADALGVSLNCVRNALNKAGLLDPLKVAGGKEGFRNRKKFIKNLKSK